MRRRQSLADRHRETVHGKAHGEQDNRDNTHIYKLTLQHKYSYYQQHKLRKRLT